MPDGSGTGGKENLRVGRYLGGGRYLVFHRGGSGAGLRFLYVSVWEGKFAILCASRLGPAKRIGWAGGMVEHWLACKDSWWRLSSSEITRSWGLEWTAKLKANKICVGSTGLVSQTHLDM